MKKRLLALLLALCMLAALLPATALAATPFRDVKPSDWFSSHVEFVYGRNLMSGTGTTTFGPNDTTTRGMMATVLWKLEGSPAATGATKFSDVKTTANSNKPDYFAQAVKWASENNVVAGYEDGRGGYTFKPNNKVTREQMAVMLYNYAKYKGYDTSAAANLNAFPDGYRTSDWAVTPLRWANGAGIINGKADGAVTRLVPTGNATRAEMAAVFTTFTQKIVEGGTTASHKVTFTVEAGSGAYVHATQTVAHGSKVTLPDNPTSGEYPDWAGHEFDHWEGANGMTVDSPITADTEFVAVWSKVAATSHKVTFNLGYDGAPAPSNVTVAVGQPVTEPTAPTREGFTFLGWYTEASGGERYVFDKAVTADMTLYARWMETKTVAVSFNLNYEGGGTIDTKNVVSGQTCPPLEFEPKRENYLFDGWFTAATDGEKFSFSTPVTEDITLYAHWTYNGPNWAVPYQMTSKITHYDGMDPLKNFSMMGLPYSQGLVWSSGQRGDTEASFNLGGKYDALTFDLGHIDNGDRTTETLYFYFDGGATPVAELELTGNMSTTHYVLNVKGRVNLRIVRRGDWDYAYATANMLLLTAADVAEDGITVPDIISGEVIEKTNLTSGQVLPYQNTSKITQYDGTDPLNPFKMMGNDFIQGLVFSSGQRGDTDASFNLGGSYDMMSFVIGHIDNGDRTTETIRVWADDVLIDSIELTYAMSNTVYSLNVQGVNKLRLVREGDWDYAYGLANITLYTASDLAAQGITAPTLSSYAVINRTNMTAGKVLPYQISSKITLYDDSDHVNSKFVMAGTEYYQGIRFTSGQRGDTDVSFNLGKSFTSMSFTVGHVDGNYTTTETLYFYREGEVAPFETIELTGSMPSRFVTIDVTGINNLHIIRQGDWDYDYAMADVTIS